MFYQFSHCKEKHSILEFIFLRKVNLKKISFPFSIPLCLWPCLPAPLFLMITFWYWSVSYLFRPLKSILLVFSACTGSSWVETAFIRERFECLPYYQALHLVPRAQRKTRQSFCPPGDYPGLGTTFPYFFEVDCKESRRLN